MRLARIRRSCRNYRSLLSLTLEVAAQEGGIVVGVARHPALEPSRFAVRAVTAAGAGGVLGEEAERIGEFIWGV